MKNQSVKRLTRAFLSKNELGAVLPLTILLAVVACVNPNFFAARNVLDILRTASFSFIVAIPLTFLLSAQGMDLSVGAVTSLGGVVCAMALKAGVSLPLAILLGLASGAFAGAINGFLIIYSNLPAFIATMGTQYAFNGFIAVITKNLAISNFDNSFKVISQYKLFGLIPMPLIYAVVLGILAHILLTKMRFGREILAIGGNPETAYLAGIPVKQRRFLTYVATSTCAALAGILMASRFASAQCCRYRHRAVHYGWRYHWRYKHVWRSGHNCWFCTGQHSAGNHYQCTDSDECIDPVGETDLRSDPDCGTVCG